MADAMKLKEFVELLKATAFEWSADNASRLSAALAYYTVFSLAPLLVIVLGLIGWAFGGRVDGDQVMRGLENILGPEAASLITSLVRNVSRPGRGLFAQTVSVVVLVVGASGVFYELHASLNTIWDVERKSTGIMGTIKSRLPSFLVIFVVGLLLLVAVAASAAVSAFGPLLGNILPGAAYVLQAANFVISFGIIGLLFAIVYKMLPDAEIKWNDVWVGAAVTSVLFAIGKFAIGLYLARSTMSSPYGAAGSLIVLLAFIYYSAQIFFFGAEFTQIYANKYGSRIIPSDEARPLPGQDPSVEKYPSKPRPESKENAGKQAPGTKTIRRYRPGKRRGKRSISSS
jgi:membrane protein